LHLAAVLSLLGSVPVCAPPAAALESGTQSGEPVRDAIAQGLAAWLSAHGARAEFSPVAAPAAGSADAGSPRSCRMRPLATETPPSPRLAVWVDCVVDGAGPRSTMRTVALKVWQQAWVAQRDLRVGEPLDERALVRTEADVARQGRFAWQGALAGHAARRGVPAGEVLAHSNVQPLAAIERGDRVRLIDRRGGGIEIEAVAVALQAGNVGQTIPARIDKATASILARVVAPGELEIP
jgi:flagella basal body P-ring formation protein FlgA